MLKLNRSKLKQIYKLKKNQSFFFFFEYSREEILEPNTNVSKDLEAKIIAKS